MEMVNSILDVIGRIAAVTGLNALVLICICVAAQFSKEIFDLTENLVYIVIFSIGILIAIFYIAFLETPIENVIVLAMGYPFGSMAIYKLVTKYDILKLKRSRDGNHEKMD